MSSSASNPLPLQTQSPFELMISLSTNYHQLSQYPPFQVLKHLWAYLRENRLQDPGNGQYFTPNPAMEVTTSESIC